MVIKRDEIVLYTIYLVAGVAGVCAIYLEWPSLIHSLFSNDISGMLDLKWYETLISIVLLVTFLLCITRAVIFAITVALGNLIVFFRNMASSRLR